MLTQWAVDEAEITVEASRQPRHLDHGVLLDGDVVRVTAPAPVGRFYRHGWQSWSPTAWVDPHAPLLAIPVPELTLLADDPAHTATAHPSGSAIGAVMCGERILLLGALDLGGRVELRDATLVATCEQGDGRWFAAFGDERDVFGAYARALGERFGVRGGAPPRMWSSWYSFYGDISEQGLLEVLDDIAGLPFDTFQVDDGWQVQIGDWHANERFASGMPTLAATIRERGYRPGLWLAPFLVHERSQVFREHPELCLTDDDGRPTLAGHNWGGRVHALDVTNPDAMHLVCDVIADAVSWGFELLKLDFLFAAALPGNRHEQVGREAAYRQAIERIRETVGDDVYLLACGAPVVASLGVFDGIRIGPDVAPWWELEAATRYLHTVATPNTRYAIATSVHRLWLRAVIDIDPDVVYFRTRYNLLLDWQRALLRDLAVVSGFRATSDPPAWLLPDELSELEAFLDDEPQIERLGAYRYAIDGRTVDFEAIAARPPDLYLGPITPRH